MVIISVSQSVCTLIFAVANELDSSVVYSRVTVEFHLIWTETKCESMVKYNFEQVIT